MKNRFIYIVATIATITFAGCKDDLNIANPNQPTTEVFWKSSDDAIKGVNAIYSTLHRGSISRWYHFATTIRSDEGYSTSPASHLVNNFDKFIITDYNYGNTVGIYADCYIGINRANQVLDNVPGIDMDANLKARIIGEAKFLRGFFYYQLTMLFGKVPLMLKTSLPTDLPSSSTQTEVYAQAANDFTEAATVLPPSYTGNDLGRATAGAAYAMLGKVYMQQKNWPKAIAAFAPLITGNLKSNYDLVSDYRSNFLESSENNIESVFEYQFAVNNADNHDDDTDPRVDNLNYGSSIGPFFAPKPIGFTDGQARRWVVEEFTKEKTAAGGRDPRVDASFLYDSTDVRGPLFSRVYGQPWRQRYPGGNTEVYFRKFLNDAVGNGEVFHGGNNYRYLRYADVLLMYAEALSQNNQTDEAYPYVDKVRQRAGLKTLTVAKPNLLKIPFLEQLKHERVTELAGEGHRWEDLLRWGDLGPGLVSRDPSFSTFVVGKHELFPLPQFDLDKNPNLRAAGQNPNY